FRLGAYLWLNDSTSEDALQEYAVVKAVADGTSVPLESWTVTWMDERTLLQKASAVLAGELDEGAGRALALRLQTPDEHGACPLGMNPPTPQPTPSQRKEGLMVRLEVYCFERPDGEELPFTTMNPGEAEDIAREHGLRCHALVFDLAGRSLAFDFTPDARKK